VDGDDKPGGVGERIRRSVARAQSLRDATPYYYDAGAGQWIVGSASNAGSYLIWRYDPKGYPPGAPWFIQLGCTCPTEATRLPICWHKTLVKIMLNEGDVGATV
jgi:hypothetical protein